MVAPGLGLEAALAGGPGAAVLGDPVAELGLDPDEAAVRRAHVLIAPDALDQHAHRDGFLSSGGARPEALTAMRPVRSIAGPLDTMPSGLRSALGA